MAKKRVKRSGRSANNHNVFSDFRYRATVEQATKKDATCLANLEAISSIKSLGRVKNNHHSQLVSCGLEKH